MSQPKRKLGDNPLAARGISALFPEEVTEVAEEEKRDRDGVTAEDGARRTGKRRIRRPSETGETSTVSGLVETVQSPDDGTGVLSRHTFYLTDAQAKKIKLYALLQGLQISEVIRWLVDEHLSVEA